MNPSSSAHADSLWWLSFVDTALARAQGDGQPGGTGFLGVAIVAGATVAAAVREAHRLGCNPGGEVQAYGPFPAGSLPLQWLNRILTKEEADEVPPPSVVGIIVEPSTLHQGCVEEITKKETHPHGRIQ